MNPNDQAAQNPREGLSVEEQLIQARRRLRETELELAQTRAQLVEINQRLIEVLESTSWKVTAPIRKVLDLVRARRNRPSTDPIPAPGLVETDEGIRRLYPEFDPKLDRETRREIAEWVDANPAIREQKVTVVLPTFDRAGLLERAVDSVLAQTHANWELVVVDDGSTDATPEVMQSYCESDPRIRYERIERSGVGPARNRALDLAAGDWIAFLDSDNTWDPEFLATMIGGLARAGARIGYSAIEIHENGRVTGYRGDRFDFDACVEANYIDMNSLVVHRSVIDAGHRFDPLIRRTSDWDFLLSVAWEHQPVYVPFVGVRYRHDDGLERITNREPWLFRTAVQERHRRRKQLGLDRPEPLGEVLRTLSLDILIRTAAHSHERFNWGDHYFAMGLAQAFERLGHRAQVLYREQEPDRRPDVLIVLRGLAYYPPIPGAVNVLWSISHPDETEPLEMLLHDVVTVASRQYAWFLEEALGKPVHPLNQATDRARFYPRSGVEPGGHMLFVGNSREVFRPSIRHALEAGGELVVYGSGWEGIVPEGSIAGKFISGKAVGDAYASAGAVLNDHWESMRDFGYISNRVYDVIASGGIPVTDTFPELEREFGDLVETFTDSDTFRRAAARAVARRREDAGFDRALHVLNHHTLDERAERILELVWDFMGVPAPATDDDAGAVHIAVARRADADPLAWPDDRLNRIVCPLTSDLPESRVRVHDAAPGSAPTGSALIVSSADLDTPGMDDLIAAYRQAGRPVFLDATTPLNGDLPWADRVWTPDPALVPNVASDRVEVIPDALDPRLWRTYRRPSSRTPGPVRVFLDALTLGTDAFEAVLPHLEALRSKVGDSFVVVMLTREAPSGLPWVETHPISPDFAGPAQTARWIRDKGRPCDAALLVDTGLPERRMKLARMQTVAMELPALEVGADGAWIAELERLIADPDHLAARAMEARKAADSLWEGFRCREAGSLMLRAILGSS